MAKNIRRNDHRQFIFYRIFNLLIKFFLEIIFLRVEWIIKIGLPSESFLLFDSFCFLPFNFWYLLWMIIGNLSKKIQSLAFFLILIWYIVQKILDFIVCNPVNQIFWFLLFSHIFLILLDILFPWLFYSCHRFFDIWFEFWKFDVSEKLRRELRIIFY